MTQIHIDKFEALASRAMEYEAAVVGRALIWKLSGRCSKPFVVSYQKSRSIAEGLIDLIVPCRSCDWCLARRRWQWMVRGVHEWAENERTWFGTLTYGPEHRTRLMRAFSGELTPAERKKRLVQLSGSDIAKYFKRLRKSGLRFRYMAVPEFHRDGFIHWHMLVHGTSDLKWRNLAHQWKNGFTKWNIVRDVKAISYVTKYLAKDKTARVRASFFYGSLTDVQTAPIEIATGRSVENKEGGTTNVGEEI